MSGNFPFGFQPPDPDDPGGNPLAGFDLANLGSALESLGRMLQAGGDGPVNWDMARQIARQHSAQRSDPGVSASERSAVTDAVRLANHWMDGASTFAATNAAAISWTRGEWVDETIPAWQRIITPVAEHVQSTMGGMLTGQGIPDSIPGVDREQLAEMARMVGPLAGMAKQLGSAMFANQVGQALGELSGDVLCSSDIGIPLTPEGRPTLLPGNVNVFADGLDMPRQDVLLFVALREVAHQRLFTHVPWLRSRLEAAVDAYARGIQVDMSQLEEAFGRVDPNNPASFNEALGEGLFELKNTPEQQAALARLETLLALIEGWVDHAVARAVADRLPSLPRLVEAMRRRRAAGGPAEKTFANLVGLEMRPRRLREGAEFWSRVEASGDVETRDRYWEHPDLLPTAEDLDDLDNFFARAAAFDQLLASDAMKPGEKPQTAIERGPETDELTGPKPHEQVTGPEPHEELGAPERHEGLDAPAGHEGLAASKPQEGPGAAPGQDEGGAERLADWEQHEEVVTPPGHEPVTGPGGHEGVTRSEPPPKTGPAERTPGTGATPGESGSARRPGEGQGLVSGGPGEGGNDVPFPSADPGTEPGEPHHDAPREDPGPTEPNTPA